MRAKAAVGVIAFMTVPLLLPAVAWGDAGAGRAILIEHCTSCHLVPGYRRPSGEAELGAPPFEVIARSSSTYPEARLRQSLHRPHWPMTRFILSQTDIQNVIDYVMSLRDK